MSFTIEKFISLSRDNRIKKTIFAIKDYLFGTGSEVFCLNLLEWLKKYENIDFPVCRDKKAWSDVLYILLDILKKENNFVENIPFDSDIKKKKLLPLKVILDDIRTPHNVGSILRTSDAFGINEVIMCGITPTPEINNKIEKTARNVSVKYSYADDILNKIMSLKSEGYNVLSLEKTSNSLDIDNANIADKTALVLGNEEFGVSQKVLKESDAIVHINMHGYKNSLNVSVAAGIGLYEISKRIVSKL